jgi:hypothetical protein
MIKNLKNLWSNLIAMKNNEGDLKIKQTETKMEKVFLG